MSPKQLNSEPSGVSPQCQPRWFDLYREVRTAPTCEWCRRPEGPLLGPRRKPLAPLAWTRGPGGEPCQAPQTSPPVLLASRPSSPDRTALEG